MNQQGTEVFSHIERTQYPYVTGTSVIGIKYKDGILIAADMGVFVVILFRTLFMLCRFFGSTLPYKSVKRLKPIGKHSLLGASGEISDFQEILKYLDELILYDNMWDDGNSLGPKEVHSYLTRVMYNRRNKFNPLWNSLVLGGIKNGQKYLGTVSMIGVHYEDDHIAKITDEGVTISPPYSLKTFWEFSAFRNPKAGAEGSWGPLGSYGSTLRYEDASGENFT
ncbi:hypothetical protein V2J09_005729 [Rumex salicifolius]